MTEWEGGATPPTGSNYKPKLKAARAARVWKPANQMKMYKIEVRPYEKSGIFYKYAETRKEAREFVASYPGFSARVLPHRVEIVFHHRASAKGYICKGDAGRSFYCGRFGIGYTENIPNVCGSPHGSNGFHFVDYYLEA